MRVFFICANFYLVNFLIDTEYQLQKLFQKDWLKVRVEKDLEMDEKFVCAWSVISLLRVVFIC